MKTCNRCGLSKPLEAFHCHPQMTDGRLNQCRDCRNTWMSGYRKQKAAKMGWRAAQVMLRGSTPEKDKARQQRRNRRFRGQRCECCRDRDIKALRAQAKEMGLELDHLIPLAKGGLNCRKNIQMVPRHYNRAKADKLDFPRWQASAI